MQHKSPYRINMTRISIAYVTRTLTYPHKAKNSIQNTTNLLN